MNDKRVLSQVVVTQYLYRGGTGCPVSPLRRAGVVYT
jgi:hypothetical protein